MDLKQEQAIYPESVLYVINAAMCECKNDHTWTDQDKSIQPCTLLLLVSSGRCLRKKIKTR